MISTNYFLINNKVSLVVSKSCVNAVSSSTDFKYKSLNVSEYVLTLFIDLKKAYDTVTHTILLDKLYSYGLRGIV